MKAAHTPTPWHVMKFDDETNFIVTNDQGDIRIITDIAEQDASLIVKAVNAHGDLVDALQQARAALVHNVPHLKGTPLDKYIDAALAKAKGE